MGANRKTGTGRRARKGRGTERIEGIRRILAVLLAAILLFTAAAPAASGKAEEKENKKGFELYQANFLYQNPGVWGDLTASMMHRMLYQTIQEESGGSFENATKVQTFLNDRDYRFKGMEGLYEQVLLEILQLQIKGGDAQRQTKSAQAWQETLWSAIGSGLDWSSEVADDGAIRSSLQAAFPKLANVIKEGLAKKGLENIGPAVASLMKGANLCLGFSSDVVSCVNSLALYLSLREYQEGTVEMLRIMYREAKDSDLRNAIHTVMEALQALDEEETIKIVKEQGTDLGVNIAATLVETCLMEVLGTAGLIVSGTSLLTNLTLNSSKIAEYYLMLKAQIVVEDAVLGALKYTYNTYTGTYTQACTLNRGVQMMYDAYEHGMDLAIAYAEQVLDKGLFNKFRSKVSSLFGEESGSAEFKKLAKTWQGIITAGRTCFDTAWLLYQEETEECPYMDIIEDPPVLVTGIKIEKTQQILTMTGTNIYLCGAKVVPSNADNKKITYKSSNTSVVKVDELTGRLTPVSPGVASIVAVTDEGGYSAKQDIVVFEREGVSAFEEQQSSIPVPTSPVQKEEKNYREYYEVNGSGVTLKERIPEFMRGNAYYIPAYLDGKPVTEVDFSESQWRQNYSSDNYEQVILPDTVERIADRSFSGMSKVVVKLNDGLKYIGEEAFQGCSAMTDGVLPDTVTEMGARAFERSGLKKVMIPTSLTVIPEGCFKNCYAITELLPGGDEVRLQEIGDSAFEECSNLRTVSIPDTVEVIGERAFAGVATTLIEMPESLIRIEKEAFLNCFTIARGLAGGGVSLDHLILPDGLVEIGDSAFAGCKELDSVSMPDTVRRIGANAFANCTYLDEVVCREAEAGTDTVQSSTIPAEVGDCAFANCRDLKYLELPAAITAIGTNVITCCPNLQTMYWPDTLESLGQQDMMKGYMGDWDDFADLRIYVKPGLKGTAESNTGGSTTASEETVGLLPDAVFRYEVSARKEETEAGAGSTVYTSCLRYLEIPAAFGKNFRLDAFYYGAKIPEIVVMGPIENVIPGEFVTDYSWVVYQTLSCLDEEGNRVVLYQRPDPSPYTKRSKAESEEAADYAVTIAEETTSVVSQEVLGRTVRINADAATVSGIGGRKLTVFGWEEEDAASRVWELGEFLSFEDIYLRQKWSYYLRIGVQTEEGYEFSLPGKYQIIVSIPSGWSQEKTAVYHIGTNGLITRLSGEYRKNGSTVEFTALADDIGSFAVVHLDTMSERVDSSWLEEMHVQYDSAPEPEGSSSSYSEGTGSTSGNGTSSGGDSGSGSDGRNSGTDTSGNPAAGEPSEELTVLIRYDFKDGAVTIAIPERKESEEANVPAVRKPDSQEASMEAWREYQSEKSAQSGQKDTSSGTDEQKDNAETGADGGDSGTESGEDSTSSQALQEDILEITTFQKKEEIVMTAEGKNAGRTPQVYRITEEKDGEISFESVKVKKDKDSGGYRATLKKAGRYYVVYGEDLAEQGMSLWIKVLLVIGGIVVFQGIVRTMVRKKRRKRRRNGSSAGTTAGSGKSE